MIFQRDTAFRLALRLGMRRILAPLAVVALLFGAGSAWAEATSAEEGLKPGDTFRDCPECPVMVVVPSGNFMMGSPEAKDRGERNERPVHSVLVRQPFAIGKYEVTFDEWDACVAEGGCNGYRPDDCLNEITDALSAGDEDDVVRDTMAEIISMIEGQDKCWGRGNRPVINVSHEDAKAYTAWLSRKTGHSYRLPSEAEWEYAARAGTTTLYHFGDSISSSQANFFDDNEPSAEFLDKTVPVGSYPANAFGLHDVHGNVSEWVEDCWHRSYAGAPSDSNVWRGACEEEIIGRLQILRGGGWGSYSWSVRSASRGGWDADRRLDDSGFRISRTLP